MSSFEINVRFIVDANNAAEAEVAVLDNIEDVPGEAYVGTVKTLPAQQEER